MSRSQQDAFIDDSDETCPLCVEEFDLSDRNFKPCPCGYQICQFCFNNIRNNLNGLCPACRRPYSDATIEYKVVSAEEFKAEQQKKNRLNNERKMREMQKREVEAQNRKHLAGLRVVQKNLVYVTGLNPRIKEEDLLQTLRGDQYFGQYGKIVKIVVNKRTGDPYNGPQDKGAGMGVYVTFARKQDAATCIAAVDGSQNGDRILRATYGTTKYCSAYLRNEQCPNRNCMFLHEPGEEAESFSRLDVSSINSGQKGPVVQHPVHSHQYAHMHPPPHRTGSATQKASEEDSGSALPPTVSWASKNPPTPAAKAAVPSIQRENLAAATPSPRAAAAVPSRNQETPKPQPSTQAEKAPAVEKHPIPPNPKANGSRVAEPTPAEAKSASPSKVKHAASASSATPTASANPAAAPAAEPTVASAPATTKPATPIQTDEKPVVSLDLNDIFCGAADPKFKFEFSLESLSDSTRASLEDILSMPPLFDLHGGKRRRVFLEQQKQDAERLKGEEPQGVHQAADEQHLQQVQSLSAPPARQDTPQQQAPIGTANAAPAMRQFTQQQQQLQHILKSGLNQQQQIPHAAFQQQDAITLLQQQNMRAVTPGSLTGSLGLGSAPNQHQFTAFNQTGQPQGSLHTRQSSRYNFVNDTAAANVGIKATANAQHMAQQQQMMPHNPQQSQQTIPANYFSHSMNAPNVQAPPGLKTSTPPAGMNIFGQAGFGGMGMHSTSAKVDAGNELLQQLMNRREKVDLPDPSILQARMAPQHPTHQHLQHQTQVQMTGAQSQQDESSVKNVSPPPGLSAIPITFSKILQSPSPEAKQTVESDASKTEAVKPPQKQDKPVDKAVIDDSKMTAEAKVTPKTTPATPASKTVKKRPEPPKVVTNIPPAEVKNSAANSPSTTTSSPAPSSSHPQVQRQGPLMMRILSSNSTTTNSSTQSKPQAKKNSVSGRPGTPGTELFSDTASTTSSIRAASPTPISPRKITPLPPRTKSKSALKKERLAAQKEKEKEAEAAALVKDETEHEPVVSRAKKKEKSKNTPTASRAVSRPASPPPKSTEAFAQVEQLPKVGEEKPKVEEKPVQKEEPAPEAKKDSKDQKDANASHLTAAQILAELQASGTVNFPELDMLKPIVGLSHRFEFTSDELARFHPSVFASLARTEKSPDGPHDDGSRVYVSPAGNTYRGLTPEQEEKVARLEAEIQKNSRSATRWTPSKPKYKEQTRTTTKASKPAELSQYLEEVKTVLKQIMGGKAREAKTAEGSGILFSGRGSASISIEEAISCINQLTTLAENGGFGAHGTMQINKAGSTVYSRDFNFEDSALSLDQIREKLAAVSGGTIAGSSSAGVTSKLIPKIDDITGALTGALEVAIGVPLPMPTAAAAEEKPTMEELEKKLQVARKETEQLEKRLNGLLKKNKKLAAV